MLAAGGFYLSVAVALSCCETLMLLPGLRGAELPLWCKCFNTQKILFQRQAATGSILGSRTAPLKPGQGESPIKL